MAAARFARRANSTIAVPIDTRILLGRFQSATREQVRDAIEAARAAFPAWSARPGPIASSLLKKVADTIRAHRWELSALMGYEAGKNRLECVGDVEESADLIEYYCDQVAAHHGFETRLGTLGPGEENTQRAAAVRRVGRDFAVQLSRWRSPPVRPAARWSPATRSCSNRRR